MSTLTVVYPNRKRVPRVSAWRYPSSVREFLRCIWQPKQVADATLQRNQTSLLPCNDGKLPCDTFVQEMALEAPKRTNRNLTLKM